MKRILVPCDFSVSGYEAYKFALDIASANGGAVFVLKIIELSSFSEKPGYHAGGHHFEWLSLMQDLKDAAQAEFDKMKAAYPEFTCQVEFVVKQGHLLSVIHDFVSENSIDLVVMGTQGATGLKEFFVGSNTEKVVRTAAVPVIAVRKAPALSEIRDIVVPTNLDLTQHEWMENLKAVQAFFGAKLHILRVNTRHDPSVLSARQEEALAALENYVRHYQLDNCATYVRNNLLEQDGILSFVDEINADMVAMATHGRKGLSYLISGSIAQKTVNRIACPIWTSVLRKPEAVSEESLREELSESAV